MASQEYLKTLLLYYEEEIEGESYFDTLSERFDDPDHKAKLKLLARVEEHAAAAVKPLIEKYGLAPRVPTDLIASGQKAARATAPDWVQLIAEMRKTYPGYLRDFEELERLGANEDQQRLSFLTEHEVAAIKFLDIEADNPRGSALPLKAYLETAVENWKVPR